MLIKRSINSLLLLLIALAAYGQTALDSLTSFAEVTFATSTESYLPHYLKFNRYGFLSSREGVGYLRLNAETTLWSRGNFSGEAGVDFLLRTSNPTFHQLYFSLHWKSFSLKMGKTEVKNPDFPDQLSSGHFFSSLNAPTIPKVGFGIYEYAEVPFTQGYLKVKGVVSQGFLEEDRATSSPFYHEKFVYLSLANLPINPYLGINHNAIYGGTYNDTLKLPAEFWRVFFGRSSSEITPSGDNLNASGAHFGLLDMGLTIPTDELDLSFSFQQPINDGTGFNKLFSKNKDFVAGILVSFKNQSLLKSIYYESIYTIHQSGEGTPDKTVNGQTYTEDELRAVDYDQFVFENFGITTSGLGWEEFKEILKRETNIGLDWGGRDNYFVNESYPDGNTYQGYVIGTPLFMTQTRFEELTGRRTSDPSLIVNNRLLAHHFAFSGEIGSFSYRTLFTYTTNYGTYTGKYGGVRAGWSQDLDYFFVEGEIEQRYYLLEMSWRLPAQPLRLSGSFALDEGDFGFNTGLMISARYSLKNTE